MREYAKISPGFWIGETGRKIREAGRDAQVVAAYLLTCPSANMIGLYYLSLPTLMHEIGISEEGALKALRSLSEGGFARYDPSSEQVFIPEMAAHQIGEPLDKKDNRVKWIINEWHAMRKSPYYMDFYHRYRQSYHLPNPVQGRSPFEAPSKPLRSQEHEQEKEQEKEQDILPSSEGGQTLPFEGGSKKGENGTGTHDAISYFCDRWKATYGATYPFRSGRDAAAVKRLVAVAGGIEKFRSMVDCYLADRSDDLAVKDRHGIGMLLSCAQRWLVPAKAPATKSQQRISQMEAVVNEEDAL